jgi:hypothetical protein
MASRNLRKRSNASRAAVSRSVLTLVCLPPRSLASGYQMAVGSFWTR